MLASASNDFLSGLKALEQRVDRQDRVINELAQAVVDDPRWEQAEGRLNFLLEQMQSFAMKVPDVDAPVESPQWSPIDLTPGEPAP